MVTIISCREEDEWLEKHRPAVAIVDVQLTDGSCHVVGKLHDKGVPFFVHSGEHASTFTETLFAKGTWIGRPSTSSELVETTLWPGVPARSP